MTQCAYAKNVKEIIIMEISLIELFFQLCYQHAVLALLLSVEFEKKKIFFFYINSHKNIKKYKFHNFRIEKIFKFFNFFKNTYYIIIISFFF